MIYHLDGHWKNHLFHWYTSIVVYKYPNDYISIVVYNWYTSIVIYLSKWWLSQGGLLLPDGPGLGFIGRPGAPNAVRTPKGQETVARDGPMSPGRIGGSSPKLRVCYGKWAIYRSLTVMKHSDFHSKLWVYRITWRMVGMNWVCPNMKELQSFLAIFIGSHDVQQRFFPDTKPDVDGSNDQSLGPWVHWYPPFGEECFVGAGAGWWWLNMKTKKESYHVQKGDELD
jgi:hypothetical protein